MAERKVRTSSSGLGGLDEKTPEETIRSDESFDEVATAGAASRQLDAAVDASVAEFDRRTGDPLSPIEEYGYDRAAMVDERVLEEPEESCGCCDGPLEHERSGLCDDCLELRHAAAASAAVTIPRHEFLTPELFAAEAVKRGDALLHAVRTSPFQKPLTPVVKLVLPEP